MKEYASFVGKRMLRRKSNMILILCSIAVLLFVLVMNMRTQRLYEAIESQIVLLKDYIEHDQKKLLTLDKDTLEYTLLQGTIEGSVYDLEQYEMMKEQYNASDWDSFYTTYERALNKNITIFENTISSAKEGASLSYDLYDSEYQQLTYIHYLHEHHLPYIDRDFPIAGLPYMTFISEYFSPMLILLCCTYILAQAFTLDDRKGIDVSRLLPIGKRKVFLTKSLIGIMTSMFVFLIITGSAFLLASICSFHAGISYPFLTQQSNEWLAIPLTSYVLQWLILGICFYTCVAFFLYVLSLWIKEDLTLFITGLCIVLAVAYLPVFLPDVKVIAHYLPPTYMNYTAIVTGDLASQYGNLNLTFSSGMIVLSIGIVAMFLIGYVASSTIKKV